MSMICSNCHSEIGSGASYCNVCGSDRGGIREKNNSSEQFFGSIMENEKVSGFIVVGLMFIPMFIFAIICEAFSIDTTGPFTVGLITFLAIMLFGAASYYFYKYMRLQKMKNDPDAIVTVGQVVDFKNIKAQIPYYYPIIEYRIDDKTFRYVYKYNIGTDPESSSNKLRGGSEVDILCNANNPFDAVVFYEKKYVDLMVIFLSASILIATALVLLVFKGLLYI